MRKEEKEEGGRKRRRSREGVEEGREGGREGVRKEEKEGGSGGRKREGGVEVESGAHKCPEVAGQLHYSSRQIRLANGLVVVRATACKGMDKHHTLLCVCVCATYTASLAAVLAKFMQ